MMFGRCAKDGTTMNRMIPRIGAAIVSVTVFLFAVCLIVDFSFGSYLVCMFLPMGYIMMAAGLQHESGEDRRVAANTGMVFAAVYAVLILLVYFAQTIRADGKEDKWLKALMMIHGVFFVSCFVLPMTGMFRSMSGGDTSRGGAAALVAWCAYFLPISILAYRHFAKRD